MTGRCAAGSAVSHGRCSERSGSDSFRAIVESRTRRFVWPQDQLTQPLSSSLWACPGVPLGTIWNMAGIRRALRTISGPQRCPDQSHVRSQSELPRRGIRAVLRLPESTCQPITTANAKNSLARSRAIRKARSIRLARALARTAKSNRPRRCAWRARTRSPYSRFWILSIRGVVAGPAHRCTMGRGRDQ